MAESRVNWLAVILACVRAVGALATWANNRQMLDAGGAQAIAKVLRAQADDLHQIRETMAAAGERFDAHGRMPDDGKYRD